MKKMKSLSIVFFALAISQVFFMSSCTEDKSKAKSEELSKNTKNEAEKPISKENLQSKDYTTDVIRYTLGTADLGTWGYCLSLSSWAKQANEGPYTFLCPTDASLLEHERRLVTEFNRPENKKLLDKVMARHLLKGQMKLEDLMMRTEVETIDGEVLKVNKEYQTIDGIKVTSRFVASETLYLLVTDDLLSYPETELKVSAGKYMKQNQMKK